MADGMEHVEHKDKKYIEQETYFLAAEDQRVFGAGIKRKHVPFVPASTTENPAITKPNTAVGDKYLSIVLKNQELPPLQNTAQHDHEASAICDVCGQPAKESHESSISHQLCLEHSYPPSHLPRDHLGLKILESHGWDPNSRLGLGATGEGIRVPIKGQVKNDTVGLGNDAKQREPRKSFTKKDNVTKRLNAKEVRKQEQKGKNRAQQLQRIFYERDLSQYFETAG